MSDIPGVGQVEAQNAASEATLQAILKSLGGKAGGSGGGSAANAAAAKSAQDQKELWRTIQIPEQQNPRGKQSEIAFY